MVGDGSSYLNLRQSRPIEYGQELASVAAGQYTTCGTIVQSRDSDPLPNSVIILSEKGSSS